MVTRYGMSDKIGTITFGSGQEEVFLGRDLAQAKNFSEEIQPRYVFRLDIKGKTEDEIFKAFHQKTRYNVRLATKKGVVVKEGTREDLKDFHEIMKVTGKRDDFIIRPLEYFQKMYDELGKDHVKLLMAYYEDKPISRNI